MDNKVVFIYSFQYNVVFFSPSANKLEFLKFATNFFKNLTLSPHLDVLVLSFVTFGSVCTCFSTYLPRIKYVSPQELKLVTTINEIRVFHELVFQDTDEENQREKERM